MLELKRSREYLAQLRSTKPRYTDAPVLQGSTLILFDMQVPFQDGEFILDMLKLAKAWGIKQGISGGDFFNQGAFSFFAHKPEDTVWKEEAKKARRVSEAMASFIPHWTMILGNHDAFLLKALKHQLDHKDLLKLAEIVAGFEATEYYWCVVKDKMGNEWRVSHPRNISMIHGRVPERLASKYHQNILSGHGHLAACSPDESGKFLCIDVAVCCDPERLDYSEERDNLRPRMNRGAVILKEVKGRIFPYHIQPQWADWKALEGMYG